MNMLRKTISIPASLAAGLLLLVAGLLFMRFELVIRASGTVRATDETRVFAPADGVIAELSVELGDTVMQGDPLFRLDDTQLRLDEVRLERELAEARARLESNRIEREELVVRPAETDLVTAEERQSRISRIAEIQREIEADYSAAHTRQITSELEVRRQEIERLRSELDLIEATTLAEWRKSGAAGFAAARAEVEQRRLEALITLIERELALLRIRLDACNVRSPRAGLVVTLGPRFPGAAVTRGSEVLKLASTNDGYIVRTLVPERNIDLLRVGTPARMQSAVFNSMLQDRVDGRVRRIAPESDPGLEDPAAAPRYEVDVEVTGTPYPLSLGSSVDVRLHLGRRPLWDIAARRSAGLRTSAQ